MASSTSASASSTADGADGAPATAVEKSIIEKHLGWTKKQGWILSGGNIVETIPWKFEEDELPHHHLLRNETHPYFRRLKKQADADEHDNEEDPDDDGSNNLAFSIVGAWERPLFCGGFQNTTSADEETYNLQSKNLFIDLRVPRTKSVVFRMAIDRGVSCLDDLSADELRSYARQHVFGGYTTCSTEERYVGPDHCYDTLSAEEHKKLEQSVAVRRHCIDWNFVGAGRPRPNKWWINIPAVPTNSHQNVGRPYGQVIDAWEELAYKTNSTFQPYYFERWERHDNGGPTPRLALRKANVPRKRKAEEKDSGDTVDECQAYNFTDDGIIVIVGDHFNYLLSRKLSADDLAKKQEKYFNCNCLVDLVDAAVEQDDLQTARSYLSIEAGHGRVVGSTSDNGRTSTKRWVLDCAIPFWNEGRQFWDPPNEVCFSVVGDDAAGASFSTIDASSRTVPATCTIQDCTVMWKNEAWEIYDCSFESIDELKNYFFSK